MPLYQPPNVNQLVLEQFSLKGKVAAVTGGAKGIGLEIVRGLAEAGADVAIIYNTSTDVEKTAEAISKVTGSSLRFYQSTVERDAIDATVQKIVADLGSLDIMVANAGVCENVPNLEYTENSWSKIMKVNLDGVMWTAQAAGKVFKTQGRGNLIITASVSAILVNIPQTQAAYNASKAAVVHLAKSLAVEWVDFARVNCVSPGFIETEMLSTQPHELYKAWLAMIPGGRICHPAELKGVYAFLASDAACYMTGANIVIDGGYTLP
ncbi:putative short chain dehydrogenase reductase family [Lipomyces oligophaga]|uniref:putative short chain dehydrogenase reductase family n=1 Tax=Lipomyces oligophaga TaxID=45792 RepID=UPI0034CF8BB7